MSDWNRGRREDDPSFYGGRSRREETGEDRGYARAERRAFGDARPDVERTDRERSGYTRYWEDADRREGFDRYGARGEKDYRGDVYRAQDETVRAGSDYGPALRDQGGVVGRNPALDRVAFGETDHPWRDDLGVGRHRGRGPRNYVRSDERIREDVSDRLSDDSWLDASDIEVAVAGSEVTLAGTVATRQDKRRAEDLADDVRGVRHVQNNLRCRASAAGEDVETADEAARAADTPTGGPRTLG